MPAGGDGFAQSEKRDPAGPTRDDPVARGVADAEKMAVEIAGEIVRRVSPRRHPPPSVRAGGRVQRRAANHVDARRSARDPEVVIRRMSTDRAQELLDENVPLYRTDGVPAGLAKSIAELVTPAEDTIGWRAVESVVEEALGFYTVNWMDEDDETFSSEMIEQIGKDLREPDTPAAGRRVSSGGSPPRTGPRRCSPASRNVSMTNVSFTSRRDSRSRRAR